MKTSSKVGIAFSVIFIAMGIVFLTIGIVNGGDISKVSKKLTSNFNYVYDKIYNEVEKYNIKELDFEMDYGELNIVEGKEFKIESKNLDKDNFKNEIDNKVWIVKHKIDGKGGFFRKYINKSSNETPSITITLPKNFKADDITLKIGAGEVNIDYFNTKNVNIKIGTGVVNGKKLITEEGNFDVGAGEMIIEEADIGTSNIKCGIGSINISLTGKEKDYNYFVKCGMGEVNINDSRYSLTSKTKIQNDAKKDINLKCGVGEIDLKVKK